MTREELFKQITGKSSFLCVGLDTDINRIPSFLRSYEDPIFEFNRRIIDATAKYCVAYKPNTAFYESLGSTGWESLQKTLDYIPDTHFSIADAKRGDIGNTSRMYAEAFFKTLGADAVTVNPYMGRDSVEPFLNFDNKWVVLLALTSNPSSTDIELLELNDGSKVYEELLRVSQGWGSPDNLMYVVGATKADSLSTIRTLIPDHFLLVPGVGAQGGSLEDVAKYGMNDHCGLLVNASRAIIYAGNDKDFDKLAAKQASSYRDQMRQLLDRYLG